MKRTFKKATTSSSQPSRWQQIGHKLKLALLLLTFIFSLAGTLLWWFWDAPLISPVSSLTTFRFLQNSQVPSSEGKIIYGFLPYWNMDEASIHPELTHLSYFSLTIGSDGSLLTTVDNETDQGYRRLQSDQFLELSQLALEQNDQVDIVLSQFNEDDINSFLNSTSAQEKLITELDNLFLAYPISGVNIDIECAGESCSSLQEEMTSFVATLHHHLDSKYDRTNLSIDVYASAPKNDNLWNITELEPYVDRFVIMAYDFHRKSSPQAGPVAPLFGGKEYWDSDISSLLQEFLTSVPSEKVLLGVPFYGYQWQTVSREPQSHTFPDSGSTAVMEDVTSLLGQKEAYAVEEHWNENALSPYITYEKDDETYIMYYENSRSLSYKLDFVNQLELGGVAIWAIGYEGDSRELWEVINEKL